MNLYSSATLNFQILNNFSDILLPLPLLQTGLFVSVFHNKVDRQLEAFNYMNYDIIIFNKQV